jgi:hypothetical protein
MSRIERIEVRESKDKRILRNKNFPKEARSRHIQYGALPYRIAETGSLEFLLITTRQTKQWMIPKGWPVKGYARENRGTRGFSVPCEVRVFAMSVNRQLKNWPEASERDSKWFEPTDALSALKDEGLRGQVVSFVERTTGRS